MLGNKTLGRRGHYFTMFVLLVLFSNATIKESKADTADSKAEKKDINKETVMEGSAGKETILNKLLLSIAPFSPVNPYLPSDKGSICTEISKGISIKIQSKNILPVFKRDGSLQCEEKEGTPVEVMKKELDKMGVKVFKGIKGNLAGNRSISVCGAPTGNINIFYISSKNREQALRKGFDSCLQK